MQYLRRCREFDKQYRRDPPKTEPLQQSFMEKFLRGLPVELLKSLKSSLRRKFPRELADLAIVRTYANNGNEAVFTFSKKLTWAHITALKEGGTRIS